MLMFCMRAETRQMSSDFGFIGSCWECHIARGERISSLASDWSLRHSPGLRLAGADPRVLGYPSGRNVSSAHRKLAANIIYRVVMTANNIRQPQTRDISQPQIMGAKKRSNEGCVKT